MVKAVFHKRFDATDPKKSTSIRVQASPDPQDFPAWVIDKAEAAGAATRETTKTAARAAQSEDK